MVGAEEPGDSNVVTHACCGVTACCTSDERATDPSTTVAEAKADSGCGCQS